MDEPTLKSFIGAFKLFFMISLEKLTSDLKIENVQLIVGGVITPIPTGGCRNKSNSSSSFSKSYSHKSCKPRKVKSCSKTRSKSHCNNGGGGHVD